MDVRKWFHPAHLPEAGKAQVGDDRLLVIAPHHDDEVIGCGGAIRKAILKGVPVSVLFVFSGWSGIHDNLTIRRRMRIREHESARAMATLGVDGRSCGFMRLRDREHADLFPRIWDFVEIIQWVRPRKILCPHAKESDREHRVVSRVVREAAWLANEGAYKIRRLSPANVEFVTYYEVWTEIENPNVIVDISDVWTDKIRALECYRSQLSVRDYRDMLLGRDVRRDGMFEHFCQVNVKI